MTAETTCCCRFPADTDNQCPRPGTHVVVARPCPICHPSGEAVRAEVCSTCFDRAAVAGVLCHEAGHRVTRDEVWTEVTS